MTGPGFGIKSPWRRRVHGGLVEGASGPVPGLSPGNYGECGLTSSEARSTPRTLSVFIRSVSRPLEDVTACLYICFQTELSLVAEHFSDGVSD